MESSSTVNATRDPYRCEDGNGRSMEVITKIPKPKFADMRGSATTLSGEEDGMVTEATQVLCDYAVGKGHSLNTVTRMCSSELAEFLRDFYVKMKLRNDDAHPLKDLRNGLHKFFLEESNIDILHDHTFEPANATIEQGTRSTTTNPRKCHKVRIDIEDLRKIYLSDAMDTNNPETLQNKVFFDISLYICNKGKDYFRSMKKTDFEVTVDPTGRRYVWLKYQLAAPVHREEEHPLKMKLKRAAEDISQVGERMYERLGDPRCPVASFQKYAKHLHPMNDSFWQRPKKSVLQSDYVWFDHTSLGNNALTKIMQRISQRAGVSDSYTNYSIRPSYIPLVETVCEQAMLAERGGLQPPECVPPTAPFMSHSNSEELSSDDGIAHMDSINNNKNRSGYHAGVVKANNKHNMSHLQHGVNTGNNMNVSANRDRVSPAHSISRDRPPRLGQSGSAHSSSSMDTDDGDMYGLMQAKTQVLDLIRGLMVKDIQKFVDWLKTVRVQYSSGELIVLCSPVDKSNVDPIPDEISFGHSGAHSPCSTTPDMLDREMRARTPLRSASSISSMGKSGSIDLIDKRQCLRKDASMESDDHPKSKMEYPEFMSSTTIKQMEFHSLSGIHCSTEEFSPIKVSIPGPDTMLVTGVPPSLQVMLHTKRMSTGPGSSGDSFGHSLSERVFASESDLDATQLVASLGSWCRQQQGGYQQIGHGTASNQPHSIIITSAGGGSTDVDNNNAGYQHRHDMHHSSMEPQQHPVPKAAVSMHGFHHKNVSQPSGAVGVERSSMSSSASAKTSVQQHNGLQYGSGYHSVMVIPTSHGSGNVSSSHNPASTAAVHREHYRDARKAMSGCSLEVPTLLTPAERTFKRGASAGTPVLKRQAHVLDSMYGPESLSMRRAASEDSPHHHQSTNMSFKPGSAPQSLSSSLYSVASSALRKESPEAKKAMAEHLSDKLRYHQEILQNSPLIKRPGERNFSGFRHCFANTVTNHSVKPEPLDTS